MTAPRQRLASWLGLVGLLVLVLVLVLVAIPQVALVPPAQAEGVRVEKSRSLAQLRLFWVEVRSASEVNLYAVPAEVARGDEFDLIDSRGFVGRVRVEQVDPVDPSCQKLQLKRARARYLRRVAARPGFEEAAVALGPGPSVGERARSFNAGEATDGPRLDHTSYQLLFVDLDGDGLPELARDAYDCNPRDNGAPRHGAVYCYDTWTRRGPGAWTRTQEAKLTYCP